MSIAALAGAASTGLPGGVAQAISPAYGLGFRFTVKIHGSPVTDLGAWQSCSGLRIDFKGTPVKQSRYLVQTRLPDRITYSKVVLKRAVLASTSSKLQEWLAKSARAWIADDDKSVAADTTITVYDSNDNAVLVWVLKGARPSAWSGPDLSATSSSVALETLELEHEGFEVRSPTSPALPAVTEELQHLPELSLGPDNVTFLFPPEELSIEVRDKSLSTPAVTTEQGAAGFVPGTTNYRLGHLILQGPKTQEKVGHLATWATPVPKKTAGKPNPCPPDPNKKQEWTKAKPGGDKDQPVINFMWGTGFKTQVQLKQLTARYTRFSPSGLPIRAEIGLTLQEVVKGPERPVAGGHRSGAANPTSGGIPGRASHLCTDADTLALLARDHYGAAENWRDIAVANRIDDPLRACAGRNLYLPAPSELMERGSGR